MFSLIISIIAIALAAVLLLTSAFYGGDALTQGTSKAEAAALANEAQQISAGYQLFKVETRGDVPADVAELVDAGYLRQAPATDWIIDGGVIQTQDSGPLQVSADVCEKVNDNAAQNGVSCDTDTRVVSYVL